MLNEGTISMSSSSAMNVSSWGDGDRNSSAGRAIVDRYLLANLAHRTAQVGLGHYLGSGEIYGLKDRATSTSVASMHAIMRS
jgi:hypothetical protein